MIRLEQGTTLVFMNYGVKIIICSSFFSCISRSQFFNVNICVWPHNFTQINALKNSLFITDLFVIAPLENNSKIASVMWLQDLCWNIVEAGEQTHSRYQFSCFVKQQFEKVSNFL